MAAVEFLTHENMYPVLLELLIFFFILRIKKSATFHRLVSVFFHIM